MEDYQVKQEVKSEDDENAEVTEKGRKSSLAEEGAKVNLGSSEKEWKSKKLYYRHRRAMETPEKKAARLERQRLYDRRERKKTATFKEETEDPSQDEQDQVPSRKLYFQRRRAMETPEKRAERLEQQREYSRRRRCNKTPTHRREELEVNKIGKMEEERSSGEMSQEADQKSNVKRPRKRGVRTEEQRARENFQQFVRRLNQSEEQKEWTRNRSFLYREATKTLRGKMSEEERQKERDKHNAWRHSLTGEKKRLHDEAVARAIAKYQQKVKSKMKEKYHQMKKEDVEKWEKLRQKLCERQRIRYSMETSEERRKRRYKDKVNGIKRKLKKKLEEEGIPVEEIDAQLSEVGEKMWKEFYPDGKIPPRKKPGRKVPAAIDETVVHENTTASSMITHWNPQPCTMDLPIEDPPCFTQDFGMHEREHSPRLSEHNWSPQTTPPPSPSTDAFHKDLSSPVEQKTSHLQRRHDKIIGVKRKVRKTLQEGTIAAIILPPIKDPHPSSIDLSAEDRHPSTQKSEVYTHECSPSVNDCYWSPQPPIPSPPSSPLVEAFHEDTAVISPDQIFLDCPHCSSKLSGDIHLRSHILSNHPEKRWNCPKCEEVVLSPLELSQHYAAAHKNISTKMESEPINSEIKIVTQDAAKFVCIKCPANLLGKFRTRQELFVHVKQQHSLSYWPCENCHLLKYSQRALALHQVVCSLNV